MKITLHELLILNACDEQLNLFKALFGESVELTEEIMRKHGAMFDVDWLATRILSPQQRADYEPKFQLLDAEYWTKRALADAEYDAQRAMINAKWNEKNALKPSEYWDECIEAYTTYESKFYPVYVEHRTKLALIFLEVVNN